MLNKKDKNLIIKIATYTIAVATVASLSNINSVFAATYYWEQTSWE